MASSELKEIKKASRGESQWLAGQILHVCKALFRINQVESRFD